MLIQGGKIITDHGLRQSAVRIVDGTIAAVGPGLEPQPGESTFAAAGRWILPGAVDVHTHFGMPLRAGLSSLGWDASSAAAVLGGTTTIIDFANPAVGQPLADAVAHWRGLADGHTFCDYGLHVTVTDTAPARLAEIPALLAAGLPTFKGFLAYKGRLMLTSNQMTVLMEAVHRAGGMLLVHAEDGELNAAAERLLQDTGRTDPRWHPLAHPAESELKAVAEVLAMAADTACPLTIVHISLAGSLALLQQARDQVDAASGRALVGEVCLHHLFADDALYTAGYETALSAICSPPLRPWENGRKLLTSLAGGELDFLSTDHCEFCLAEKSAAAVGGFPQVPNGCGGVGERLVLSHTLAVQTGALSLPRWQEVLCEKPATLMGLAGRKGRLAPGYDADIVVFDPNDRYDWQPLGQSDRAGSLWAGRPVQGRVTAVWLRGRQIVGEGRLKPVPPGGVFLPRRF